MSDVIIFSVGGMLFIVTTWATIAFGIARVIPREDDQSGVDRNEVDSLPPPSQA